MQRKKMVMATVAVALVMSLLEVIARLTLDAPATVDIFEMIGMPRSGQELVSGDETFRPIPNSVMPSTLQYRVNADGFRHDVGDLPSQPPIGVTRIVTLGDSVTFGINADDHHTYPFQLQSRLGKDYAVYNLGRPGYSSHQGLAVLQRYHQQLRPDILVVGFGWNDIADTALSDRERSNSLGYQSASVLETLAGPRRWLLDNSRLAQSLLPAKSRRRVSEIEFAQNLRAMTTVADTVIYMTQPWVPCDMADTNPGLCRQMIREDRHRQYNDLIRLLASETGQPMVDAALVFEECEQAGLACISRGFLKPDGHCDPIHPNAFGSKWLAAAVAQKIEMLQ